MQIKNVIQEEKKAKSINGGLILFLLMVLQIALIAFGIINQWYVFMGIGTILIMIAMSGFKVLQPNTAYVLTFFGKYVGTLRGPGFFYVNPFISKAITGTRKVNKTNQNGGNSIVEIPQRKLSLKAITLDNKKQKINDLNGNPIEIGIVVIWRVVDSAKAIFNVENFAEFLSIQSDSALRSIVREYPYDCPQEETEKLSLRGDSCEIAENLKKEIQKNAMYAGIEVLEAKITHLAYAPEIAAVMLQRQQASAVIDARKMIVDGAVSMVQMALAQLKENNVLDLDEERKAAMVSNLLVILCGNKDAQPIINSGTIY